MCQILIGKEFGIGDVVPEFGTGNLDPEFGIGNVV
jgi:hypothetical protein